MSNCFLGLQHFQTTISNPFSPVAHNPNQISYLVAFVVCIYALYTMQISIYTTLLYA